MDSKVTSGMCGSASEFVREAIREKLMREQERAHTALAAKLKEGIESGTPITFSDQYTPEKKRRFLERYSSIN